MSYAYKGKKVEKELKKNSRYRGTKQNRPLHVKKKKIDKNLLAKLDLFRNEVVCRHDSNQHKAREIWNEIKSFLTKEQQYQVHDSWIHYLDDETTTTDGLGGLIKLIKKEIENGNSTTI